MTLHEIICENYLKPLAYAWWYFLITVFWNASATEILTFVKYFNHSQNSPVIGWNIWIRSKFPLHWLSGRLLYQRMIVRKLEVLGVSFPCFSSLESVSSTIAHIFLDHVPWTKHQNMSNQIYLYRRIYDTFCVPKYFNLS